MSECVVPQLVRSDEPLKARRPITANVGHKYDSKQISRIVGEPPRNWKLGRRRSLQGQRYKFLYVDGANFLVRINGHVSRQSFCAVLGVSEENERFEVLALEMGDRERSDLWASLFEDLAERGLNLETVELGIMDGLPGLEAIFQRFFPRAQTQRCQKPRPMPVGGFANRSANYSPRTSTRSFMPPPRVRRGQLSSL
jgi:transposase-like protein